MLKESQCAGSGKRLSRKSWYYREGKFYFNKRAWEEGREKIAKERADERKARAEAKAKAKAEAETAQAKTAAAETATEAVQAPEEKAG